MRQMLFLIGAACIVGCQSQSPYAVIGPPTVPAPTTAQAVPYYPPLASGAASTPASTRPSVSADGPLAPASPLARVEPDPTDRQPLRIVENPAAGSRTAAAPARANGSTPSAVRPAPPPQGSPPAAPARTAPPAVTPQTSLSADRLPSVASRLRGFQPSPPTGTPKTAPTAVMPAGYQQQSSPAFIQSAGSPGTWKAR